MTITDSNIQVSYTGDGLEEDFVFNMKTFDSSWILVFEDDVLSVATVTVTLNADQDISPGGSVNVSPAPATGVDVDVIRKAPLDQLINFTSYSGFPADTNERGLDKLTILNQQLEALAIAQGPGIAGITSSALGNAIDISALNIANFTNSFIETPNLTTGGPVNYTLIMMVSGAPVIGEIYTGRIHVNNTGACTLFVGAGGFQAVKLLNGSDLFAGHLKADMTANFYWNGINYILLNPYGGNGGSAVQVVKLVDETVNNVSAYQDDDELFISLDANGVYEFEALIFMTTDIAPDFQFLWDLADGTYDFKFAVWESDSTVTWDSHTEVGPGDSIVVANINEHFMSSKGIIIVGGTGGIFKLQWAQLISDAASTTVKANSYMKLNKLN